MARHSRKAHRKGSHKAHRKGSRKVHRKGSRQQRGGASCAAQSVFNRSPFSQQGGMAPISQTDDYLIDAASRMQAQTAPLDSAFGELSSVIPRTQSGGRRRRKTHRKGSRKTHRTARRKTRRKGSRRRQQGGSLAGFNEPYMLGVDIAKSGSNPQFLDYLPAKGAQAA
jgi:hypothetical protein